MNQMMVEYLTSNEQLIEKIEHFWTEWNNDSEFISTRTSGSTGLPKEIRMSKEKMKNSALATGRFFNFQAGQNVLLCLNADTIGGKMLLVRAFLHNMRILISDVVSNPIAGIEQPIDFISMVPMQIRTVLKETPLKLNLVKTVLVGGASVDPDLEKQLSLYKCEAYESFGMTETMSHIALKKLNDEPVFKALPGVEFRSSEEGKLEVIAPMLGIDRLITNDIVELIDEHSFRWKGRADFVINSGGIKIHPELVEKKMTGLIKERFFIAAQPDAVLGERVVLMIEDKKNGGEEKMILEQLKVLLDKYEVPKQIIFIPEFIETPSGKVNRLATINKYK